MADQSWNPLSYSQNICVGTTSLSNTSSMATTVTAGLMTSRVTDSLMADTMAAMDLQNASNGINKMVNDLIASNDNEFQYTANSVATNPSQSFFRSDISANVYDCGDLGLNGQHKLNASMAANGLKKMDSFGGSANQSAYNPMVYMPSADAMSSHDYSEMKSLPQSIIPSNQIRQPLSRMSDPNALNSVPLTDSMLKALATNPSANPLPAHNQLTNHLISSLTSHISSQSNSRVANQSIISQSNIGSKPSLPLPYNRSQSFQMQSFAKMPIPEVAAMNGRPVRSIRARNASQSASEPINKFNYFFDKCCELFKHLEKERKKIEIELVQTFVGQKISSANNIPISRMPPNASKMDRIITDMFREHAKVITIVAKMEQLRGRELSEAIHTSIEKWYEAIRGLHMRRKCEVQTNGASGLPNDLILEQMCDSLKVLFTDIRSVRTSLWCALVVTLYGCGLAMA